MDHIVLNGGAVDHAHHLSLRPQHRPAQALHSNAKTISSSVASGRILQFFISELLGHRMPSRSIILPKERTR
jgi:hypothetical protein